METLAIYGGKPVASRIIPLTKPYFGEEEKKAVLEAMSNFASGSGPQTEKFEAELCKYLGVKYTVFLNSCTAALHLSLMVAGIKRGEIICPDYTFTSTALAALLNNAVPKLCDVELDTGNIDPEKAKALANSRTKAIIPVHYAGHACRMDELRTIANESGLLLVEDAAQAIGAEYKGKKLGSLSDIGCFSFHGTKNLVCGEGGALVTNNEEWAEKAYILREKGTDKYHYFKEKRQTGFYEYISQGYSYVQSDILAALALEQLKKIDKLNVLRAKHAAYLSRNLKDIEGIGIPVIHAYAKTNWHIYAIRVQDGLAEWFAKALNAEGVNANIHYIPLHLNKLYRELGYSCGDFPVSEKISRTLVRLPMHPGLTKEELDNIIYAVRKIIKCKQMVK